MIAESAGALAALAAAAAWSVRGRSAQVWGPVVWQGPPHRRAMALTFDDGPGESTAEVLSLLEQYGAKATFFVCGCHARRRPDAARAIAAAGHEIGNHTDTHARLWLRSPSFLRDEIGRAQASITAACGVEPRWFRPTYGVRWPGLETVLREHGLRCAMWTALAGDWRLPGAAAARKLARATRPGAILLLHDGREASARPDISSTLTALRVLLPRWRDQGFHLATLSGLLQPGAVPAPRLGA
jgi:peptidoglycan/xylan/chitin deacetylase (PgdA/CDA1 family)